MGCSLIAKLGHGAKKPRIENEKSINSWVSKKGFSTGNVPCVSPEEFYFFVPAQLNSIFLFNGNGTFLAIGYSQGKFCVRNVDKTIETIKPYHDLINKPDSFIVFQQYEFKPFPPGDTQHHTIKELKQIFKEKKDSFKLKVDTTNLDLDFLFEKMRTLSGEQYHFKKNDSTDYYLILPFAKYMGNWSQVKNLRKFYKAALNNSSSNIQIIFLNLDKQEWWGKDWNEKIQISN
jgi:hypothetical protein